jgi:hypothetical protein
MRQCRVPLPGTVPINKSESTTVVDPDQALYDLGPPGFGSVSQRYGSVSFYHQAKLVKKPLIPNIL